MVLCPCPAECRLGPIEACSGMFLGIEIKIVTTGDSQEKVDFLIFFFNVLWCLIGIQIKITLSFERLRIFGWEEKRAFKMDPK